MTLAIYLIIIIANLLIGIKEGFSPINKLRKKNAIIILLSFIGIFLLISGYRNLSGLSNDLSNSEYEFSMISKGAISSYEMGYVMSMKLLAKCGADFYVWRSVMAFCALTLIFFSIKKWSRNPHFVIGLFTIYLSIVSAERFRNFLAMAIFQVGLCILYYSNYRELKKKILFVISIILAASFHSIFLFYLVLLFSFKELNKRKIKIVIGVVLLFCIFIFLNNNTIPGLSTVISIFNLGDSHWMNYLSQRTKLGFLYPMVLHILNVYLTYWAYKLSDEKNTKEDVFVANASMMIFFPLYMLQLSMSRIASNMIVIASFSTGEVLYEKGNIRKKTILAFACIGTMILWLIFNLVIITKPEAVLFPFFTDNVFF